MLKDLSCVELLGTEINSLRIANTNLVSKRSLTLVKARFSKLSEINVYHCHIFF